MGLSMIKDKILTGDTLCRPTGTPADLYIFFLSNRVSFSASIYNPCLLACLSLLFIHSLACLSVSVCLHIPGSEAGSSYCTRNASPVHLNGTSVVINWRVVITHIHRATLAIPHIHYRV